MVTPQAMPFVSVAPISVRHVQAQVHCRQAMWAFACIELCYPLGAAPAGADKQVVTVSTPCMSLHGAGCTAEQKQQNQQHKDGKQHTCMHATQSRTAAAEGHFKVTLHHCIVP